MVLGGQRQVRAAHRPAGGAQAVERLRAGDLVDQVQVDVEQVGLPRGAAHHMRVPHLLGQCLTHHDLRFLAS